MATEHARTVTQDLIQYIERGPTAAHAVVESAARLRAAGFTEVAEGDAWDLQPGVRFFVVRGHTALVAGQVGTAPPAEAGFRLAGAHTDSPGFRVKWNNPLQREGYVQLGVEIYGGPLLSSWADRDLGIAGRLLVKDGDGTQSVLVRLDRPLARIPLLAIHLDRGVNEKGLVLDAQKQLPPVIGLDGDGAAGRLAEQLADTAGVTVDDILDSWLELFDLQPATLGGLDEEFVFTPKIDNLAGCHACLEALLADEEPAPFGRVVALFDSEEVGSATPEGAGSTFLDTVLERLCLGGDRAREDYLRAISRSILVSVDGAHALHPSFADRHEPQHKPLLGGGPVVKINAKERYATTLDTRAHLGRCAAAAGVPLQYYVHRTDLPCGSTIGPISATLMGVATADVGSPMISMHSVREMGGTDDQAHMIHLLAAHLKG